MDNKIDRITLYIEALIFAAVEPISKEEIKTALESSFEVKYSKDQIINYVTQVVEKFAHEASAIEVVEINNGYQFMTKAVYHSVIGQYLKQQNPKKLSRAALEVLSIVAYKQPVTKTEIEAIRGVNCDYTVQKLLEKELCEIVGRDSGPGRPLLYGTSTKFMEYFGLKSLSNLPKLSEIESDTENEVGQQREIEIDQSIIDLNDTV